jgi:hypothetical protein
MSLHTKNPSFDWGFDIAFILIELKNLHQYHKSQSLIPSLRL